MLSLDEIYKRTAANGYKRVAHHDEDSEKGPHHYFLKTTRDQNYAFVRYEMYFLR